MENADTAISVVLVYFRGRLAVTGGPNLIVSVRSRFHLIITTMSRNFFPPPTDMLSGMLGAIRDMEPISALALAESFGLLDGKWKDFVEDKCSFAQRMIGGMNVNSRVNSSNGDLIIFIPARKILQPNLWEEPRYGTPNERGEAYS
jgi:hypothetical protein